VRECQERYLVLMEVNAERDRQEAKWGRQTHPVRSLIRSIDIDTHEAELSKEMCDVLASDGLVTWYDILLEEFREVFAETDPKKQRIELIHVAAVAVSIIQDIDMQTSHISGDCAGQNCHACANPCGKYEEAQP